MPPLNSVVSHPPEASSSKKPHITPVEAISCKRKLEKLGSNQALAETKQCFENGSKSKVQVGNVNKNPCGLIVKPGACVDSETKEDQGCVFECMVLRTCPICKTFSSASSTTLNAHIVKCLSVDSAQQPISKPRVKVKTMVDIYATAKGCTLEDLDERNGTKWNKNKPDVCNKRKKLRVLRAHVDEDAAGIGTVYIDDKGQKLRIISEVNENPSRELQVEDVSEKKTSKEGKGNYRSFRKRLGGKEYYKLCKGNALEILEYQRGYSGGCRDMKSSGPRIKKHSVRTIRDQSKNGLSLSEDPLVPSHASVDLFETVSSPSNSQNSWRSCGEIQVSGKITKVFASEGEGVMKLKKARSENEEDSGRWESDMTREVMITDYNDWDGNEETDASTSGGEENDYERWEETGNNKEDGTKTNDADAEFKSIMVYEQTGCETEEQGGSTFMEVDPIPIPGPPGSFLQSPWDMDTDAAEHHGNFSVITSHVKSSQNHQLDLTDRNSSESSFGQSAPHMIQQDLSILSKTVPAAPSTSNSSVFRLMGKDVMVINQREETSHEDPSLKPTYHFQDLSRTQHVSPSSLRFKRFVS
ncbi:hypothetical protein HA466_0008750 [Hirschfeldia incana]|nr:hypothetical protein HA466_0008750 [Hirschfeldia incana]